MATPDAKSSKPEEKKPATTPATTPAGAIPPVVPSDVVIFVPVEQINDDWRLNISRQFLDDDHMRTSLARMMEQDEFKEFTQSIREKGLLNALIVKPAKDPKSPKPYDLVAGFRRMMAVKVIGLKEIPVRVRIMDAQYADEVNLIENLERKNVSTFGLASAAVKYYRDHKLTSEKAAERLGLSPPYVRGLVMARENLAPEILRSWADRDEDANPAFYRATSLPNLRTWASLKGPDGKPNYKEQLANFQVAVLMAQNKSEEEARKIVADGGFDWGTATGDASGDRGPKKKGQSVKKDIIREVKKALREQEFKSPEAAAMREGAVALATFLLSKGTTKEKTTVKAGGFILYDEKKEPEVDDAESEDDSD